MYERERRVSISTEGNSTLESSFIKLTKLRILDNIQGIISLNEVKHRNYGRKQIISLISSLTLRTRAMRAGGIWS